MAVWPCSSPMAAWPCSSNNNDEGVAVLLSDDGGGDGLGRRVVVGRGSARVRRGGWRPSRERARNSVGREIRGGSAALPVCQCGPFDANAYWVGVPPRAG
jgi:hypothetical protein